VKIIDRGESGVGRVVVSFFFGKKYIIGIAVYRRGIV